MTYSELLKNMKREAREQLYIPFIEDAFEGCGFHDLLPLTYNRQYWVEVYRKIQKENLNE